MAKAPELHAYSSQASLDRLLLLVAAIANNPGIAPESGDTPPMQALIEAMQAIAQEQGIDWPGWSEHTIRKDLVTLRKYGILRSATAMRSGYVLGQGKIEPPSKPYRPRKSALSAEEIVKLRAEGKSLAEVAKLAGISREAVRQIEQKQRRLDL
jgi:hypothetical protein